MRIKPAHRPAVFLLLIGLILGGCSLAEHEPVVESTASHEEPATPISVRLVEASSNPTRTAPPSKAPTLPNPDALPTRTANPSGSASPTQPHGSSASPTLTTTLLPSATHTLTPTPTSTSTPSPTLPALVEGPSIKPAMMGEYLPIGRVPISSANLGQMAHVATWGKGAIIDVVYAPDGVSFAAASPHGIAIYDSIQPHSPPRWVPFKQPVIYKEGVQISSDGKYIQLQEEKGQRVIELSSGQSVSSTLEIQWTGTPITGNQGNLTAHSSDGELVFRGKLFYDNKFGEDTRNEMYDAQGQLLYRLTDWLPYIKVSDRCEPESCDLKYHRSCENQLEPLALAPYKASFSPNDETFAVLYRSPTLGYTDQFSILRVYSSHSGQVLGLLGTLEHSVKSFAYAPDGDLLLVAFTDGTLQLWDIPHAKIRFSAQHFTSPIQQIAYTRNSKYLLVQRDGSLESHLTINGAMRGKYKASVYDLAPSGSRIALGSEDGSIRILDLETGYYLQTIQGHSDRIYSLAYSPDGLRLASSGRDCQVNAWDVRTGKFIHPFQETVVNFYGAADTASRIFIYGLQFVPEADQLLGYGSWGALVSWYPDSGLAQYTVEPARFDEDPGEAVSFQFGAPNLDLEQGLLYIESKGYNLQTGLFERYQLAQNSNPAHCEPGGETSRDGSLRFTPGSEELQGYICVIHPGDMQVTGVIQVIPPGTGDLRIEQVLLSPDGSQLAVTTSSGVIYIYQIIQ